MRLGRGKLKEYFIQNKRFNKSKKLYPNELPFYLSVVAVVKNETPYIGEWIEYHILVGIQKFYIYDNESTDDLQNYLKPYIESGFVEYICFPGKRIQSSAYNDAINSFKHSSFWLLFVDIDEFIVPISTETIPEFLRGFEDYPGIEINQVLYGSSGNKKKTERLVIKRFKDHSVLDHPVNHGVKSIVNPPLCFLHGAAPGNLFQQ